MFTSHTTEAYDISAKRYEEENKTFTLDHLSSERDLFIENLKGKTLLDLGSGPGTDSLWFKKKGYKPLCIDFSSEMIKLCKNKDLRAIEMDMKKLQFNSRSFAGVWAKMSLMHLEKSEIPSIIRHIHRVLKTEGVLFISIKEGKFDGLRESSTQKGEMMYFSEYYRPVFEDFLSKNFTILKYARTEINKEEVYLNWVCIKKEIKTEYKKEVKGEVTSAVKSAARKEARKKAFYVDRH